MTRAAPLLCALLGAAACGFPGGPPDSFIQVNKMDRTAANPYVESGTYEVLFGPAESQLIRARALALAGKASRETYLKTKSEIARQMAEKEMAQRTLCSEVRLVVGLFQFDKSQVNRMVVRCLDSVVLRSATPDR